MWLGGGMVRRCIAALIPNARRKTINGQTHQAAPEAVAPLLSEFFGAGS